MNIGSVNQNSGRVAGSHQSVKQAQAAPEASEKQAARKKDRLELSSEAKTLQPIEARLESGFYDKPEVLRQVALKLSLQFPISGMK